MGKGGGDQVTRAEIPPELKPLYRGTAQQILINQNANPLSGPSAWWTAQGRRYFNALPNRQYYNKVAGFEYPEDALQWGSEHPLSYPPSAWDPQGSGGDAPGAPADPPGGGSWGGQPYGSSGQPVIEEPDDEEPPDDPGTGGGGSDEPDEEEPEAEEPEPGGGGGAEEPAEEEPDSGGGGDDGGGGGDWWDDLPYSIPDLSPYFGGESYSPTGGTPAGGSQSGSYVPVMEGVYGMPSGGGQPSAGGQPAAGKSAGKYDTWVNETKSLARSIGGK